MTIRDIRADHYRIPLPTALSDSTHGTILGFELVTVRVRDADGAEGVGLHYGGRGGAQALAISAVDIALWDLRARRHGVPLWRLLSGFDPRVPCYAGGIDLEFTTDALLKQTDENLTSCRNDPPPVRSWLG